jgi:hypothetical protein
MKLDALQTRTYNTFDRIGVQQILFENSIWERPLQLS